MAGPLLICRPCLCTQVVWTRSGSGALRELGETFPWSPSSRFAYLTSNHNRWGVAGAEQAPVAS